MLDIITLFINLREDYIGTASRLVTTNVYKILTGYCFSDLFLISKLSILLFVFVIAALGALRRGVDYSMLTIVIIIMFITFGGDYHISLC